MTSKRFQTLIFDLDDTLVPTSDILIPPAMADLHQILVENGLPLEFHQFNEYRKKHISELPHREVFRKIISDFNLQPKEHIFNLTQKAFYALQLPEELPLIEPARNHLNLLQQKYQLYLLTAGQEITQMKKVKKTRIEHYFQEIVVADEKWQFNKQMVIQSWMDQNKLIPNKTLSIGNRLKDEIRASKMLGLTTCHFAYGEHATETPKDSFEIPDFQIHSLGDLIKVCQL